MTNENLTKIEISLNDDNMERLKEAAKRLNASYSDIITDALDFYDLEQAEEFQELVKELLEK